MDDTHKWHRVVVCEDVVDSNNEDVSGMSAQSMARVCTLGKGAKWSGIAGKDHVPVTVFTIRHQLLLPRLIKRIVLGRDSAFVDQTFRVRLCWI